MSVEGLVKVIAFAACADDQIVRLRLHVFEDLKSMRLDLSGVLDVPHVESVPEDQDRPLDPVLVDLPVVAAHAVHLHPELRRLTFCQRRGLQAP